MVIKFSFGRIAINLHNLLELAVEPHEYFLLTKIAVKLQECNLLNTKKKVGLMLS